MRILRRALPALLAAGCSGTDVANALTPAGGTRFEGGLAYGSGARQRLDLTLPDPARPTSARVLFIHGGSWEMGGRGDYRFLGRSFAARGVVFAAMDYTLWPAGRWPAFIEDAAAATAWLHAHPGLPAGPLVVLGHSAGATIALALACDPRWLDAAGPGRGVLAGAVGLAGVYAWEPDSALLRAIFADAPGGLIEVAPDAAALAGVPPVLLQHGLGDTLVRPAQSERLAARIVAAGGRAELRLWPGVGHIGLVAAMAAPVRALGLAGAPVLDTVCAFIAARTG